MARGFRMEIHYRDIQKLPPEVEQGAIYHDNEDSFLGAIDIISMHVPGGDANRHWLNAARLAKMKQGSLVVNSGRGVSVHDESLIAALKSGHIRAAGLDVYDGEPKVNPGYSTLGERRPAAASRQRHDRGARRHGQPGAGEPRRRAAQAHRPAAPGGVTLSPGASSPANAIPGEDAQWRPPAAPR